MITIAIRVSFQLSAISTQLYYRSQEIGARSQNKYCESFCLLDSDYWLLDSLHLPCALRLLFIQ